MLTKEAIFDIIKNDNLPVWWLYEVRPYNCKNFVGSFKFEHIDEKTSSETEKINASINALDNRLSLWANNTKFEIKLSNSKTANGTGQQIYEFQIKEDAEKPEQSLSGFQNMNFALGQIEALNERTQNILRREISCDFKEREIEKEFERLRKAEQELEKDYTDAVQELANKKTSIEETIKKIPELAPYVREALEYLGIKLKNVPSLSGANTKEKEIEETNPNIIKLNEVAQEIIDADLNQKQFDTLITGIRQGLTQLKNI